MRPPTLVRHTLKSRTLLTSVIYSIEKSIKPKEIISSKKKKKMLFSIPSFLFSGQSVSSYTKGQLTNCDFKIVGTPPFYLPSTSKTFSSTANNLKLQSVKYAVHNYLFTQKKNKG